MFARGSADVVTPASGVSAPTNRLAVRRPAMNFPPELFPRPRRRLPPRRRKRRRRRAVNSRRSRGPPPPAGRGHRARCRRILVVGHAPPNKSVFATIRRRLSIIFNNFYFFFAVSVSRNGQLRRSENTIARTYTARNSLR